MTKTVRTEYLKDSKSLYLNRKHLKEIIIKNIAGTRKRLITTRPKYLVIIVIIVCLLRKIMMAEMKTSAP